MSWRVLALSEPDGAIPQLLVKTIFHTDSYTVHVTCLSNIWSENLDLDGIVDRATAEQSPIEVSKQDTAQLTILLDNVQKSLAGSDDATCRITRKDTDGLTLHTTVYLPKPLDSLTWKFQLKKRSATVLKNELILPLLVSSHIQHERTTSLVSTIKDKDKAITRLVDQFESSNLDLGAAFPIISGLKGGRKPIKREQAAKHVPALRPFREDAFREQEQLKDSDVTTSGLFQEALSEFVPRVPAQLKSDDADLNWWEKTPQQLHQSKAHSKSKSNKATAAAKPARAADSSDDETEDEFETHENFKTRNMPSSTTASVPAPSAASKIQDASDDDSTEDEDLDAPPKSQSQSSSRASRKPPPPARSPTPQTSPPPKRDIPTMQPKPGFRIGGKAKTPVVEPPPEENSRASPDVADLPAKEPLSSQLDTEVDATLKKPKRTFRIGGKGKAANGEGTQRDVTMSPKTARTRATQSPAREPPSSPPAPLRMVKEETPVDPEPEETPEEKAERRRAELKRKAEEVAKKQGQTKKKRRF